MLKMKLHRRCLHYGKNVAIVRRKGNMALGFLGSLLTKEPSTTSVTQMWILWVDIKYPENMLFKSGCAELRLVGLNSITGYVAVLVDHNGPSNLTREIYFLQFWRLEAPDPRSQCWYSTFWGRRERGMPGVINASNPSTRKLKRRTALSSRLARTTQ